MALDITQFKKSVKEASKEDIARALELLAKEDLRKARYEAGELKRRPPKYLTEEEKKEAQRRNQRRRNAYMAVMINKATSAGITCSEDEIQEYLAAHSGNGEAA